MDSRKNALAEFKRCLSVVFKNRQKAVMLIEKSK